MSQPKEMEEQPENQPQDLEEIMAKYKKAK